MNSADGVRIKLLLVLMVLLAVACGRKVQKDQKVLVRINDEIITLKEFDEEFSKAKKEFGWTYTADKETALRLMGAFLNQMIEERLILMEAEKMGIKVGAEEVDAVVSEVKKDYRDNKSFEKMFINEDINFEEWRKDVRKKLLVDKVISRAVLSQVQISTEDVEEYYNKYPEKFRRKEEVRARQILVREEKDAERARERILAGEDFAAVAREVSLSPDAEDGGDLGYFGKGVMPPEFDEVVFTIEPGKLSDVVKSDYGYHLFLVEDRKESRELPLDEVYDEIVEKLRRDWEDYLYVKWMDGLKAKAEIEINKELLKRLAGI